MANIQPWYKLAEAQAIFRSIVRNPPKVERKTARYAESRDEWCEYTGTRVARLERILEAHVGPYLGTPHAVSAGLLVTVQQAVDAVFPADQSIRFWALVDEARPVVFDEPVFEMELAA